MQERRPIYPIPDFADRETYRYIPRAEVARMLAEFGLGPSKQMVHAAYVAPDNRSIVGVLRVTKAMCQDHLTGDPIFQGILGPEAIAQTWIILNVVAGRLTPDKTARIEELEKVRFRHSLYPDVDVNIYVRELPEPGLAYGQILLERRVITEAVVRAVIVDKVQAKTCANARKQIQTTSHILFPLQDYDRLLTPFDIEKIS